MAATSHRVLLVDDNADSSEPLSLLLQTRGHETRISTDGEEAIALADDFRPDCVVLDLGLPRMDGYEVARRLRERPYGAESRAGRIDRLGRQGRAHESGGSGLRLSPREAGQLGRARADRRKRGASKH